MVEEEKEFEMMFSRNGFEKYNSTNETNDDNMKIVATSQNIKKQTNNHVVSDISNHNHSYLENPRKINENKYENNHSDSKINISPEYMFDNFCNEKRLDTCKENVLLSTVDLIQNGVTYLKCLKSLK